MMPNYKEILPKVKDVVFDLGARCFAKLVSDANKHVADPEKAECDCRLHEQAKLDAALAAYDQNK
ncbi:MULTISPECIES: hypothetical protein [unclassified Pseudarthrobacter]|uniref:hypothetical protein n=1 Tax=unclassified Pseudarthrobacter TaxID=2647000 RepID=UPI003640EDAE